MVVREACRRRGVGRALVSGFEREVAERGGHTILLGADDEDGRTSIGGIDLYPGVLDNVRAIENLRQHPFELPEGGF
ncbi:MAG: hypothetical protein DMF64_16510 [Acidobacteria bacterium]|nr:MAG: hypothetical protein DMF64_16510 [Acidobacteriota bacterium]